MNKDDFDKFRGDVVYRVWRAGGDPDSVDYEDLRDDYLQHGRYEAEDRAVHRELARSRRAERRMSGWWL